MSITRQTEIMEDSLGRNADRVIYQLLSTNGDGSGTVNMNQNAATDYFVKPAAGETIVLRRMNIWEVDGSFTNAAGYGAGGALTNGIAITVENAEGVIKNYTPVTIKTTYEWSLLAGIDSTSVGGAGNDPHLVRWTFAKGGGDITLDGDKGEYLKVSMGDAMDFLTHCRMMVQGYIK